MAENGAAVTFSHRNVIRERAWLPLLSESVYLSLDSAPQQVRSAPWQLSLAGGNDQIAVLYCITDADICYPPLWEDHTHCHPTAVRPGHAIGFG